MVAGNGRHQVQGNALKEMENSGIFIILKVWVNTV